MKRFLLRFFPILIALVLIAIIFWTCPPANAADVSGQACSNLGTTQMTADRTGLVFCSLKEGKESASPVTCEENGGCVWKSMTDKAGSGVPVGAIIAWPVASNPDDMQSADGSFNWLDCNGQSVPSTLYPELYKKIGAKVPDLRGLFLRGQGTQSYAQNNGSVVGVTTTIHASGALGAVQGDSSRKIDGQVGRSRNLAAGTGPYYTIGVSGVDTGSRGEATPIRSTQFDSSRITPTSNESRPINMAVRYLIRARS